MKRQVRTEKFVTKEVSNILHVCETFHMLSSGYGI